jgi:Putative prokaryotic signal transducing protein
MVPVAVTRDQFEARVIAARLGSEGIVWELRGNAGGPYPLGQVAVLVEEADLEVAREVLATGVPEPDADDPAWADAPARFWVAVLVVVAIATAGLLRAAVGLG